MLPLVLPSNEIGKGRLEVSWTCFPLHAARQNVRGIEKHVSDPASTNKSNENKQINKRMKKRNEKRKRNEKKKKKSTTLYTHGLTPF